MQRVRAVLAGLLAVALVTPLPLPAQPPAARSFGPEELEQIAAPIALYPDPLLAQVLMAATYPLEVIMAARFVQANPGLKGAALDQALAAQSWDDSVKSLAEFPQVLAMMNENLAWTQRLGDAALGQQAELMDAVQRLRARARAQGVLATTPQQVVTEDSTQTPPVIAIQPAAPDVVYVPSYDPFVVYGPWPYPAYPPYYYYPPGWVVGGFFTFGVGVVVGTALWGWCDWPHHRLDLHVNRYHVFTRAVNPEWSRSELTRGRFIPGGERLAWEHSPEHRRGVQYRMENTQQRFGRPPAPDAAAREIFRGRDDAGALPRAPVRPPAGPVSPGPAPGPRIERGPTPSAPGRQAPSTPGRQAPSTADRQAPSTADRQAPSIVPPREPGAFQGLGRDRDARSYSERGRESRRSVAPPPRPAPRPTPRPGPSRPAPSAPSRGGARR